MDDHDRCVAKHGRMRGVQEKGREGCPPRCFGSNPDLPPLIWRSGRRPNKRTAGRLTCRACSTRRGVKACLSNQGAATAHQGKRGWEMNMRTFVKRSRRVHLLVDLKQEQCLEDPELCGRTKIDVHEYLPAKVPSDKICKPRSGRRDTLPVYLVETRRANSHHGKQEVSVDVIRGEGWLVKNGQLSMKMIPI